MVRRAMSKKPGARYDSIDALAQDFTTAMGSAVAIPATNRAEITPAVPPAAAQPPPGGELQAAGEGARPEAAGAGSEVVLAPTIAAPREPQADPDRVAPLFPLTTLSGSVGELHAEVPPRRSPVLIMGLVVAAAMLVGGFVYLGTRPDDPDPGPRAATGPGIPAEIAPDLALRPDILPDQTGAAMALNKKSVTPKKKGPASSGGTARAPKKTASPEGTARASKKSASSEGTARAPRKSRRPTAPGELDTQRKLGPVAERFAKIVQPRQKRRGNPMKDVPGPRPGARAKRLLRPAGTGGYGQLYIVALIENQSHTAKIYVDGRLMGGAPVVIHKIEAGEHQVRVEQPNYETAFQNVQVQPGQRIVVRVKLTPTQR